MVSQQSFGCLDYTSQSLTWQLWCRPHVARMAGLSTGQLCTPRSHSGQTRMMSLKGHTRDASSLDCIWRGLLGTKNTLVLLNNDPKNSLLTCQFSRSFQSRHTNWNCRLENISIFWFWDLNNSTQAIFTWATSDDLKLKLLTGTLAYLRRKYQTWKPFLMFIWRWRDDINTTDEPSRNVDKTDVINQLGLKRSFHEKQ